MASRALMIVQQHLAQLHLLAHDHDRPIRCLPVETDPLQLRLRLDKTGNLGQYLPQIHRVVTILARRGEIQQGLHIAIER